MRRAVVRTSVISVIAVVAALAPAAAAAAEPANAACGMTVTASLRLNTDLDCPGDGLVVAAGNIDLDLGGHTVHGNGVGTGIRVAVSASHPPTVTVHDGRVQSFNDGVRLDAPPLTTHGGRFGTATFSRLHIIQNVRDGVVEPVYAHMNVLDSYIANNGKAFDNETPPFCEPGASTMAIERTFIAWNTRTGSFGSCNAMATSFTANVVAYNGDGVQFAEFGAPLVVRDNQFWHNQGNALTFANECATVQGNHIIGNKGIGIEYGGIPYARCAFVDNEIWGNSIGMSLHPLAFHGGDLVTGNVVTSNDFAGILVDSGGGLSVNANVVAHNGLWSWAKPMLDSAGTAIHDGIHVRVRGSSPITLAGNHARENSGLGILSFNATDGGGNVSYHNGTPTECAGVPCFTPPSIYW